MFFFLFIIFLPCVTTLWTFLKDSTAILSDFCSKNIHLECQKKTLNIPNNISIQYLSESICFHTSTWAYTMKFESLHNFCNHSSIPYIWAITVIGFSSTRLFGSIAFCVFTANYPKSVLSPLLSTLSPALSFCYFEKWNKFHPYVTYIPRPVSSHCRCSRAHTSSSCTTVSHSYLVYKRIWVTIHLHWLSQFLEMSILL